MHGTLYLGTYSALVTKRSCRILRSNSDNGHDPRGVSFFDRTYRAYKGHVGLYGELCQEYVDVVRSLDGNLTHAIALHMTFKACSMLSPNFLQLWIKSPIPSIN